MINFIVPPDVQLLAQILRARNVPGKILTRRPRTKIMIQRTPHNRSPVVSGAGVLLLTWFELLLDRNVLARGVRYIHTFVKPYFIFVDSNLS